MSLWRCWTAAGVLAIAGYHLLPTGGLAANLTYNAIGLAGGLAIVGAVWLHRPRHRAMWYLFAGGQVMSVVGDVIYEYYEYVLDQEPYPSLADVFYLGSYPMMIIGLLLLIRRGRGRGLDGLVDSAIIATGLGLVFWIFVLHPVASDTSVSALERVISTTYPAVDVLLLAMLARLFTDAGTRTTSTRLLSAAAALVLVADTAFSLLTLYTGSDGHEVDALFLLSYVLWAAAALHPSMAARGTPASTASGTRVGLGRLGLLSASSLLAPAMLFVPAVGDDGADRLAIAICGISLFLLVIIRMAGFMGKVQRQSGDLERLAMQDDLTGLANRRRLEQALREALAGGRPQVAFLGLNGFKNVNDELGRPVGDRVLGLLSDRIAGASPAGALVARMGGDEFAVLLADASADEASAMAHRLVAAMREPVVAGGHELLVGVGIGLAGGTGVEPVELLRRAEAAMYAAKLTGEPCRRWTTALDERSSEFTRLGAEMRTALDTGQFRVVYQPIVQLPEGRVRAVEALVRWEHPERGLVSPAYFIPVAEQNGLIVELGVWILATACRQLVRWRADLGADAPEKVSVNVSARQLARPGFAATVAAVLADTGLPARRLTLEVTETAVFEGGQAVTAVHELRALGVRIALDDFGTGHSSLGLLQTVPVDVLKVDKSFVDNITEAGRHAVIAEALIQVSTGLGLDAVAEGVETAEQARALYRLGYRLLQGYHYGRPVADPDFDLVRATVTA
jgi:diguanylate cyclase (GGDEF)-like protein